MSLNAKALQLLADKGLSLDDIIALAAAMDEGGALAPLVARRTHGNMAIPNKARRDPFDYLSAEKIRVYDLQLPWGPDEANFERPPPTEWQALAASTFRRDGWVCTYCGDDVYGGGAHCDHIHPISRGGSNHWWNLTTACQACNCSKRDKTPEEWRPLASHRFPVADLILPSARWQAYFDGVPFTAQQ